MDCYIYYRVPVALQSEALEQAGLLQAGLAKAGLAGELKRRPQASNDLHTWMEVYKDIPPNFDTMLQQALQQTSLPSLIQGDRHFEYFVDAMTCA
jgi:hypothetical protein